MLRHLKRSQIIFNHHMFDHLKPGPNFSQVTKEMFRFNATVMGYGNSEWMAHVLDVFPALVVHAADPQRDLGDRFGVQDFCNDFVIYHGILWSFSGI